MGAAEQLAERGFQIAYLAAEDLIVRAGAEVNTRDFLVILNRHAKEGIEEGIRDASVAWEEGNELVANMTFTLSMTLAGVRAANEVLGVDPGFCFRQVS